MSAGVIEKPVGVIGNDEQGLAIARRLAASNRRVVYSALPGSPKPGAVPLIEPASTPTDVAFDCAIVIAAIEDTEILRQLLLGNGDRMGVGAEMFPGSVLVDAGARTPRELGAFLGLLGTRGVAVVDAAILGGSSALGEGRAKILLGGYPDSVELASAVLAKLGSVEKTGPLGSAHAAAALMGYIEAAHAMAREEALALGSACGLSQETLTRVLSDRPPPFSLNVIELERRAELAKRIARDRGFDADIIDVAAAKRARRQGENG